MGLQRRRFAQLLCKLHLVHQVEGVRSTAKSGLACDAFRSHHRVSSLKPKLLWSKIQWWPASILVDNQWRVIGRRQTGIYMAFCDWNPVLFPQRMFQAKVNCGVLLQLFRPRPTNPWRHIWFTKKTIVVPKQDSSNWHLCTKLQPLPEEFGVRRTIILFVCGAVT